MAQSKTDPWYTPPPAGGLSAPENAEERRRYGRAINLGRFLRHPIARRQEYEQHCLDNWQDYMEGKIEPPTGRKMKK